MTAEEFFFVCSENGMALDAGQIRCFKNYSASLAAWNEKINLISRRDVEQLWERHILHSVAVLFHAAIPAHALMADIGTGGGLPGIPLKICRTDISMVLIDSIQKKINAVSEIVDALRGCDPRMMNLQAVCGRGEELAQLHAFKNNFDVVVARAVAPLDQLATWSVPLLKPHGTLLALKGGTLDEEIAAVQKSFPQSVITNQLLEVHGVPFFTNEQKRLVTIQL